MAGPHSGELAIPGSVADLPGYSPSGDLIQAPTVDRAGEALRSADIYSADHPAVRAVAQFGVVLQSRTNGRFRLAALGENSSSSEAFMIASVRNGTLDLARVDLAALASLMPEAIVPSLPGLFRSAQHRRRVFDGPIGEDLLAGFDRLGLVGLCFYDTGVNSYYGARPVRSLKDLTGLRVRVARTDSVSDALKAPSELTLSLPYSQVGRALKTGAIDLAEGTWVSFVASGHHKVARYFSETEHTAAPSVLIFSKRRWQTLSAADQLAVRTAARESVREFRMQWSDAEEAARNTARAAGVEVISNVDQTSFVAAAAPLYPSLSPNQQELVRRIRDTR